MQRTGPDSLEGCFIALTICLISTLMYGVAGLSSFLFVTCMARYNTDRNHASFPFVLNSVIQSITGPFAGYLAKKFGVRIVVLSGSLLAFVGIGTCFFAESIIEVTVLWGIVFGVGFGSSILLLPAVINEYFFKHRSKALGISFLGSPIGFLIFPPVFEFLYDKYGLSGTFLLLSGINLHCVPLSLLLRQPQFKEDNMNTPLSNSKEQVSYLSTDSRIRHCNNPECGKKILTNTNVEDRDSCFARYSLEFLWKQPDQPHSKRSEDSEQYIFTLNKSYIFPFRTQNNRRRSYEKINGHCYKNSANEHFVRNFSNSNEGQNPCSKVKSEDSFMKEHTKLVLYEKQRKLQNSPNFRRGDDETNSPVNVRETNKNLEIIENCNSRLSPSPYSKHNYAECSAIYFGTNEKRNTNEKHNKQNKGCVLNSYNVKAYDDSVLSCHISPPVPESQSKEVSVIHQNESLSPNNNIHKKLSNWRIYLQNKSLLRMCCNPVFIVMCISNALFSLQFTTLTTVIIDFAEDHHIDPSHEKFIMMCISIMGLCGMLSFGWVTDGGYMTRNRFASLCLFIGSISLAVFPQIIGFVTLMITLAVWCVFNSSFVLLIPAILAEYLEKDIQGVAVSAVYVLCGPLYLVIPPLLGYFRDGKGSYDYVFYFLSSLSLLNSTLVFHVPCMARLRGIEKHSPSQDTRRT